MQSSSAAPALGPEATSSGRSPGEVRAFGLHTKLVWLTVFRTVATSLSLGAVALRGFSQNRWELSVADSYSFALIALVYVATLVYSVLLRQGRHGRSEALLQVAGDIVIATSLVFVTGGGDSPFTFAFSLSVVSAAILFGRRGALIAAALAAVAYCVLIVAIEYTTLSPPIGSSVLGFRRLGFVLGSNVLALFLIAALVGFLSRELSVAGGELSARKADLESLGRLQAQIFECMPSGLITCEGAGEVTFVNPAAAAILGLDPDLARGRHVEELLPGVRSVRIGAPRRELQIGSGADAKMLGLSLTRLRGEDGALLIVFQDLSELRRVEEDLRRADRLAAVGTIAAQLAHEIRNPLAAMRGSAQLLGQAELPPSSHVQLTNILLRESDRLSRLVEDFLRFARPQEPAKQPLALELLIAEMTEVIRNDPLSRGVELAADLTPVTTEADADQLRQVLLNLVRNALQAAAGNGKVQISLQPHGDFAHLKVWDSAGSLSEEAQQRLFEPFFTTREGGTGLGLSTAQSIVHAHGGTISVRSSRSSGTEFLIRLPLSPGGV